MIVLDESIYDHRLVRSITHWYQGQVVSVLSLRLNTLVKDEAIPMLLQAAVQPTFLTINVTDFWRKVLPHPSYCIIAADLRQEDSLESSDLLRRCLRLPEFRTKNNRMGKIILYSRAARKVTQHPCKKCYFLALVGILRSTHLEYYSLDRTIIRLDQTTN